jgi:hypothetical protein
MEGNLIFFFNCKKTSIFENGRRPQLFEIGRRPQLFKTMQRCDLKKINKLCVCSFKEQHSTVTSGNMTNTTTKKIKQNPP